jgi:hypothetical protein
VDLLGDVDRENLPPHDVEVLVLDGLDAALFHGDHRGALRSELARVSPLQIAGEYDVRRFAQHLALMDVAERPVVVALVDQRFDATRRVVFVPFASAGRRVQKADVQGA